MPDGITECRRVEIGHFAIQAQVVTEQPAEGEAQLHKHRNPGYSSLNRVSSRPVTLSYLRMVQNYYDFAKCLGRHPGCNRSSNFAIPSQPI
jgi:hypothetical protein